MFIVIYQHKVTRSDISICPLFLNFEPEFHCPFNSLYDYKPQTLQDYILFVTNVHIPLPCIVLNSFIVSQSPNFGTAQQLRYHIDIRNCKECYFGHNTMRVMTIVISLEHVYILYKDHLPYYPMLI